MKCLVKRMGFPIMKGHHRTSSGGAVLASRGSLRARKGEYHLNSKVSGLKKLKLILRGIRAAGVLPYRVFPSAESFRLKGLEKGERLLVRMDEKGKEYRRLSYSTIPRQDLIQRGLTEEDARMTLGLMQKKVVPKRGVHVKYPQKLAQYIIHPTRFRSEVRWTGGVELDNTLHYPRAVVFFGTSGPDSQEFASHRIRFEFFWNGKSFEQRGNIQGKELFEAHQSEIPLSTVLEVIQKGILSNQLKFHPNRRTNVLFNTWKDDASFVEFYDLRKAKDGRKMK